MGEPYVRAGRILTALGLLLAASGVTAWALGWSSLLLLVLAVAVGHCCGAGVTWWVCGRADRKREAVTGG